MNSIQSSVKDLYDLVLQGKALEAFEKYYAEDVVMQENEQAPTVGKEANRKREAEFFGSITEFRGAEIKNLAIGQDTAMVEMAFDFTHKEWGPRKYTQVGVQKWKDGKIVSEKFYYGN